MNTSLCALCNSDLIVAGAVVADRFDTQLGQGLDNFAADGAGDGDAFERAVDYGGGWEGAVAAGGEEGGGGGGAGGG